MMDRLYVISAARDRAAEKARRLSDQFAVRPLGVDELAQAVPDASVLVDIDLDDAAHADVLRSWLAGRPNEHAAIFAVDRGARIQVVRAYSIGATDLVVRPLEAHVLVGKLARTSRARPDAAPILQCDGIAAGITALQNLFGCAVDGTPLNVELLNEAADKLMAHIDAYGMADWVRAVRVHHSPTYQHCLLVCGAAAAFGHALGFSDADRRRVALAGLLHDVGKAKVPLAILEKPGKLDRQELAEVHRHALYGHEVLQGTEGLPSEMIDVVVHHHEYLDGSGYPHGLRGEAISELTRVTTIVDVFSALIERRAYRPAMSGSAAYQIMQGMGPKLDRAIVRAFERLSAAEFE